MGCRLAGGLSLDQESCDNHASHPLLPPPRLCLAPHPVPTGLRLCGHRGESVQCPLQDTLEGRLGCGWHLLWCLPPPFGQFSSVQVQGPNPSSYSSPSNASMMVKWIWCVCVSEGETRSLVSSLLLSECTGNLWLCHPGHARSRLSVQGRRGSGSPRLVWLSTILSWKID